jgi:rSAM/selenodomain-associated transferase 2
MPHSKTLNRLENLNPELIFVMRIAVVMPVLNEEKNLAASVRAVQRLVPDELVVVDGGSTDRTRQICADLNVHCVGAPRGRAAQMNVGAARTTGEVLLFLHADTRLPDSAFDDIRAAFIDASCVGGRFDVRLDSDRAMHKIIGAMISLRSRLSKVGTGDQAIFIRRAVFARLGGFPEIPLMEDIALSRAMKRAGKVACLRSRVVTSARRWKIEGSWRTIFKMWILKSLYLLGVSPAHLKRFYDDGR